MKIVKRCTVHEIESDPNFQTLIEEYARESSIEGMPHPKARMETYKTLEANGSLAAFGAYVDGTLCGFVSVLSYVLQHYGAPASVSESIFVSEPYRKTGIGLDLIRTAKQHAKDKGSLGLLVSAPTDSVLAKFLANSKDCVETNRVFFFSLQKDAITAVAPTNEMSLEKIRRLETEAFKMPQVRLETTHVFHAGMYARTCKVPAGVLITGALIKIATLLIVEGDAMVYVNDGAVRMEGYNVLSASAGRKQAFLAMRDTYITMVFPTENTTVEDAEDEFTDEADNLQTRRDILTQGDAICLAQSPQL